MKTLPYLLPTLLVALLLSGCVTTPEPVLKTITVKTTPPGAKVKFEEYYAHRGPPKEFAQRTPADIQIVDDGRMLNFWLVVELEGYATASRHFIDNISDLPSEVIFELTSHEQIALDKENEILAIPGLDDAERQLVREKRWRVGMPPAAIEYIMGRPRSRLKSGGVGAQVETLTYPTFTFDFVEGKLVRWWQHTSS